MFGFTAVAAIEPLKLTFQRFKHRIWPAFQPPFQLFGLQFGPAFELSSLASQLPFGPASIP